MRGFDVARLVLAIIQDTEQSLYCTLTCISLIIATTIVFPAVTAQNMRDTEIFSLLKKKEKKKVNALIWKIHELFFYYYCFSFGRCFANLMVSSHLYQQHKRDGIYL